MHPGGIMSTESRLLPVVAITGSSIMVGCGGYSGGSCGSYGSYGSYGGRKATGKRARRDRMSGAYLYGCPVPANVGADGIYEGTLTDRTTQQGDAVVAIIADNGDGRMSAQDGSYYRLTVSTTGTQVSGSFVGFSQQASFPDGRQTTSGSLAAMLAQTGLNGTLTDQAGDVEALSLNLDNAY